MDTDPRISPLIHALHDWRDGLRQFAVRRMVSIGEPAIPHLLEALKASQQYTQESAAIALATLGPVSIPYLLKAMKSEDRSVRWGAAWVLASMGPEARTAIPEVALPASKVKSMHGVWSDSWLTKVRERLQTNRMMDVINIAGSLPELV